jgi:hypothetical protein
LATTAAEKTRTVVLPRAPFAAKVPPATAAPMRRVLAVNSATPWASAKIAAAAKPTPIATVSCSIAKPRAVSASQRAGAPMTFNADWAKCVMPANNSASPAARGTVIAPVPHADAVMPPVPVRPAPQMGGQRVPPASATLLSAPAKTFVVLARSAKSSPTPVCRFRSASKTLTPS